MNNLIAQLREKFDTDLAIAAALGITRQAFSQAAARGRLSETAAIKAAALLSIDAGAALLANAKQPTPPVIDTRPELPSQLHITAPNNTNYAPNWYISECCYF